MDRNRAHDVIHIWNGDKAADCPVCNGTLAGDEQVIIAAKEIAAQNYEPRTKPLEVSADTSTEVTAGEGTEPLKMTSRAFSVMTDVMSFSEGQGVPSRIKIIPTGKFNTPKYGSLEITREDLLEMAQNFHKGVRAGGALTGLPIDIEHGETQHRDAAAGWIKDIIVMDDGAYADVDWTELGKDLLEKGIYKFYSPEFTFDYVDNETSTEISNVVIGGGLVNKPLFDHSLPPLMMSEDDNSQKLTNNKASHMLFITNTKDTQNSTQTTVDNQSNTILQASEKDTPMDLQTILNKEKSQRTSDEQLFVAQNLDQLSDEQKVAEGFVVAASEPKVEEAAPVVAEETAQAVDTTPEDTPEAPKEDQPTVTASEKATVTAAEVEIESLKTRLAAAEAKSAMAFAEIDRNKVTETVRKFQFNEKGGKFAPAQGDQLINVMLKMGEKDRAELIKFVEGLPDKGQMLFGEKGSDEDLDKSKAADILSAKAHELVKNQKEQGTEMTFSEALKRIANENPELYQEQLKPASR